MQEDLFNLDSELSLIQNDYSEVKASFVNWDTSGTPCKVLGRKINSAAKLSNNADSICRYPLPVQISTCKPKRTAKRQFQDISNRPRSSASRQGQKSKTPEPGPSKPSKTHSKKSIQIKTIKKPSKPIILQKPQVKKTKISVEIPLHINENNVSKKNIDSIVLQTLKKQKIQKKKQEESKNEEKFRQNQIKKNLAELNKNTRVENFNRFKQEKFQPVCPWGTDERRITRVNDVKILKDAEELRKKKREERERSKSAGKSRIGLDVIKVKKDVRVEADEEPPVKNKREKDRSIIEFMRKQKIQRQKSKELQIEKAREDENKRLMQLLELEKITRAQPKREKSQKCSKKKYVKKLSIGSYTESDYNDSEDDEVMHILHGRRTASPDSYEIHPSINSFDQRQSGRECRVFGVFPEALTLESKANVTQMVNDIVEKRIKVEERLPIGSSTMPLADVKSGYSVINTEEEYKDSISSDISRRKDEIRKKLSELRNRVDKAKKHESQDFDEKFRAATKIQAWVRGWLTRQAIQNYLQEQDSENWLYHEGQFSAGESESRIDAERSETESLTIPGKNRKKQEVEAILKTQAEWRLIQKEKLGVLKNKDLEDMRFIAKKVGSEDFLMRHFEEIIERRYELIEQLFDENIEAVKAAVKQAIEDNDPESLLQTLEKQENFASEIFLNLENNDEMDELMKLKHQFDFKNIWNYSDNGEQSIRISELEFESPSGRTQSEKIHQMSEKYESEKYESEKYESEKSGREKYESEKYESEKSGREKEGRESGREESESEKFASEESESEKSESEKSQSEKSQSENQLSDHAINSSRSQISSNPSSTLEFDLPRLTFIEPPSAQVRPNLNPEPLQSIFESDVVGILEDLTGQELYLELIEEAWESLLTSSSFINSSAELLLNLLLNSESIFLQSLNLFHLLEKPKVQSSVPSLNFSSLKPTGISKEVDFILQYIRQLFDYLQQVNFDLETLLNTPNSLDPVDLLGKMQEAEIGVFIEKTQNTRILPLHLYIDLEKEPAEASPLQELQHIHNKLVFDVVGELLMKRTVKPLPLPWTFEVPFRPSKRISVNGIVGEIVKEIKEINQTQAGKTPKVEFISNSQDSEEDVAAQMREEQLSAILAAEIMAQEHSWVNYEFEETQVKLDLSDMTLEELVEETVKILNIYN
jgi:hypothetical protein